MSTPGQTIMYARGGRRRKLLDLNVPPPTEDQEQVGGPVIPLTQGGQGDQPGIPVPQVQQGYFPTIPLALVRQGYQPSGFATPAPIDVEELDDDVVISSPRAFEEARNRRTLVVDVEAEVVSATLGLNQRNTRRRVHPQPPIYVNLEGSSISMQGSAQPVAPPPPPPPPPPEEATFNCPVCMGPIAEEVTTKCGHIFCKGCIRTAIATQPKCPTCRRKVTNRDIIRIYLPAANCARGV